MTKKGPILLLSLYLILSEAKDRQYGTHPNHLTAQAVWQEYLTMEPNIAIEHPYLPHTHEDLLVEQGQTEYLPIESPVEISVVIPFYNCGSFAADSLRNVLKLVGERSTQVVAVDDASRDDTLAQLSSVRDQRIEVVERKRNPGYSAAVRDGILRTEGDYVLLLDSDISLKPTHVSLLTRSARNSKETAIFFSRFKAKQIRKPWSEKMLTLLFRKSFNLHIDDFFPPIRYYNGSLIRQIAKHSVKGDLLLATLLYLARHKLGPIQYPL
ncbi:glycosyltransferase [Acidobacteria bacterium AH-259-D05]|nr:glycosyltransferase [Acidobacteria bacterium AH-259-D05]